MTIPDQLNLNELARQLTGQMDQAELSSNGDLSPENWSRSYVRIWAKNRGCIGRGYGQVSDPPLDCKQYLELYVEESDLAEAKNELRNEAAEQGADYVRLDALEYFRGGFEKPRYRFPLRCTLAGEANDESLRIMPDNC